MGVLSSAGYGGHVARRLTIPTLVLPLLIGYLCVKAEHAGLFGYRDALSILAGLTVMLLGGVVVYTGRSLNRADEGRRILEQCLTDLAERDPLTNLYNRRRFEEGLEHELIRSARHSTSAALIMFDLDRLKHVNDSFGHAAGDQLLLGVAETLTTQLRVTDVIARLGGDEFAALLPETDRDGAELAAAKLLTAMQGRSWATDAQVIASTISAGIAVTDSRPQDADTLSRAADAALYRAKTAGGNRYTIAPDRPRSVDLPKPLPTPATPSRTGTSQRAEAKPSNVSAPAH
jgi:diguanylate cyclase (GGDEF)-like protein